MITTCWIGPVGLGVGDGVGLRFFPVVGARFVTDFLIPRPVYGANVKNQYWGLSRYREGYANGAAAVKCGCRRASECRRTRDAARLLARGQLSVGRADLPAGE